MRRSPKVEQSTGREYDYRLFIDNIDQVVVTLDRNGCVTFVSPAIKAITGFKPEHILSKPFKEFVFQIDTPLFENELAVLKDKPVSSLEFRLRKRKGGFCWVRSRCRHIDKDSLDGGTLLVLSDISGIKHLEDQIAKRFEALTLAESESVEDISLREIVDIGALQEMMDRFHAATGIPVGIFDNREELLVGVGWQDLCVKFHRMNAESLKLCRRSDAYIKDNMPEKGWVEYKCPNGLWDLALPIRLHGRHIGTLFLGQLFYDGECPDETFFRAQALKYGFGVESYLEALRRVPVFSRERVSRIMSYYESFVRFIELIGAKNLAQARAIAERDRSRQQFADQAAFLENLLSSIPSPVFYKDRQLKYLGCNPAFEAITDTPKEKIIGKTVRELWPDRYSKVYDEMDIKLLSAPSIQQYEAVVAKKDGSARDVIFYKTVTYDALGDIAGIIGVISDITERKRAEEALRYNEEKFRQLAESLPLTIFEMDLSGRITYLNRNGFEQFGLTEEDFENGVRGFEMVVPEDRQKAMDNFEITIKDKCYGFSEYTALRKDGTTFPIILKSNTIVRRDQPVGLRGFMIDISERRQLEDEHNKAAKLESIGILAGGIAHDFNNLLTSILGYVSLAKINSEEESIPGITELLASAEKATLRAKNLSRQLLTFSRGGEPIRKLCSLAEVVKEAAEFAVRGSGIRCEHVFKEGLWPAEVDEGQIGQVIQNIVINACQAMPQGGSITISAANTTFQEGSFVPLPPGKYLKISIADQGHGIPPDYLSKIFDPYFTTKQKGSGLGLTTAYSIIHRHGGHISAESSPGKGTTFNILIPAATGKTQNEKPAIPDYSQVNKKILVMDDEEAVRKVISMMLERLGCVVTGACEGREAISLYRQAFEAGQPFDIIFLDLTVQGGMGGLETMSELLKIDPAVKAIVASGYASDPIMANFKQHGFTGCITKPFRIEELRFALQFRD